MEVNHGARGYWNRRRGMASGRVWLEYACSNDPQPDVQRGTAVHARRGLVAGEPRDLRHARNGGRNSLSGCPFGHNSRAKDRSVVSSYQWHALEVSRFPPIISMACGLRFHRRDQRRQELTPWCPNAAAWSAAAGEVTMGASRRTLIRWGSIL